MGRSMGRKNGKGSEKESGRENNSRKESEKENKTLGEQGKAGEEKSIAWRILNLRRNFFSRATSMLMCIFT